MNDELLKEIELMKKKLDFIAEALKSQTFIFDGEKDVMYSCDSRCADSDEYEYVGVFHECDSWNCEYYDRSVYRKVSR